MEAFSAMKLSRLPPAGNPISCIAKDISDRQLDQLFSGRVSLYGSGTAALAAALIGVRARGNDNGTAEVLLPAYGCPDLVSAVVYAGCRPVAVDLEPNRPWLDFTDLESKIGSSTIAIVAVNFLGIRERIARLKDVAVQKGICLVEDSAQSILTDGESALRGDYVIYSFGRGKPVSLLGGGCVVSKTDSLHDALPSPGLLASGPYKALKQGLKILAYNRLLTPGAYGIVSRLPLLRLGETRYRPLSGLAAMPGYTRRLIASNVDNYRHLHSPAQGVYHGCISELSGSGITDLAQVCGHDFGNNLLRYPVLFPSSELRDRVFNALDRQGLGVSLMYRRVLSRMPVAADYFAGTPDTGSAEHFAARLLTLPVHSGVDRDRAAQICQTIIRELT